MISKKVLFPQNPVLTILRNAYYETYAMPVCRIFR